MGRWERFWWAFYHSKGYGFWFGMRQAWRFAIGPGKVSCLSRQMGQQFARAILKEYNKRHGKAG